MRPPAGSAEFMVASWTAVPLAELVASWRLPTDRPAVVAVDGRGAGGKSFLAARLHAAVAGSAVVHTDDVAWNFSILGWADELARHVLEPVRRGQAVHHRPPGWVSKGREGAIEVPAGPSVLIVEGVGAGRRELAGLLDATVWVQSDWDTAHERGIRRDVELGVNGGGEQAAREFWDRWMAEELPFLEQQQTWARADAVVAGHDVIALRADEIAVASPWPSETNSP